MCYICKLLLLLQIYIIIIIIIMIQSYLHAASVAKGESLLPDNTTYIMIRRMVQ